MRPEPASHSRRPTAPIEIGRDVPQVGGDGPGGVYPATVFDGVRVPAETLLTWPPDRRAGCDHLTPVRTQARPAEPMPENHRLDDPSTVRSAPPIRPGEVTDRTPAG